MKLDNGDNFHLQHHLEAVKVELVEALQEFCKFMQKTSLIGVTKTCNNAGEENKVGDGCSAFDLFQGQVEYIRNFLLVAKIFPLSVKREMGWKVLRDCDDLWKHILEMALKTSLCGKEDECTSSGDKDVPSQAQVVSLLVLPTGQLIHDCLEMNLTSMDSDETALVNGLLVKHSMTMFGESVKFLTSSSGIGLGKPDFLRIMGLSQKLWKFAEHVKSLSFCKEMQAQNSKLVNVQMETIEEILDKQIGTLLSSGNGRSFVKFWCELMNIGNESRICAALKQVSSLPTTFPEIYMIFTSYLHDDWFWNTDTGKALTPVIIRGILQDMSSDMIETRKRAAFVLKLLVAQYSQNRPIFDPTISESALISLNKMVSEDYIKFWDSFFDLHDILNETQQHIVQPVLHKLQIFQDHSTNDSVLVWLPVILKKMISHDNRSVVKQGFEQFILTGEYLKNLDEHAGYRLLAKDFLEKHIMPLVRDHIGWILNDPEEFFKNIVRFGQFLVRLQTCQMFPEFKAGESVLTFLTSSGKCMGPHAILFLVAAFDEILCDGRTYQTGKNGKDTAIAISETDNVANLNMLMNQLTLLVSNNLTTVGKYFRELLEQRCISILSKVMPFVKQLPKVSPDSFVFTKLLAFFGSISWKVFSQNEVQEKIRFIVATLNDKESDLLNQFIVGSGMYEFAKPNLSYTSTVGLLRFVATSSVISDKQMSDRIKEAVGNFTVGNSHEILPGSVPGLREFYQRISCDNIRNKSLIIFNELFEKLQSIDDKCSVELFMRCVQQLEVLSVMPAKIWNDVSLPKLKSSSSVQMFLLQKLYVLGSCKDFSPNVLNDVGIITNCFDSVEAIEILCESYFAATERNLLAEYHQIKFMLYSNIFESSLSQSIFDVENVKDVLNIIVDEIEKCDSKGVAAGLLLTKSITKFIDFNNYDWDGTYLLDEIASVGWSLVFDLRKSEAFWVGIKAFVELITCPYYVKNGFLNKYADLLFEYGETVSGLPFVLVEQLVETHFPDELMEKVNEILIKAALAGGALPKNNRVSFAIWEHLRKLNNDEDNDPENFSSDCKSRLLACEKIRSNLESALSDEARKDEGLKLLRGCVLSVLERNEYESIRRKRYFQGSSTHRTKQRIWQLLLILQPYFDFEISKLVLEGALAALSTDSPQPSVRYMGEWLIILIIHKHPGLNTLLFDCLDNCIQKRLGFGAFFSRICLHTSKLLKCSVFYDKALQSLATLTLSQHLTVRIYSQIAFQKIYQRADEMHFTIIVQKYAPIIAALSRASAYVSGNCSKLLDNVSQDFYVNVFDSLSHYCPEVIFTLLPRLSGMIKDECILEVGTIRKLVLAARTSSENENNVQEKEKIQILQKTYMDHEKSAWHLKTVVADGRELGEEMPDENLLPVALKTDGRSTEMNYQKKLNPWKLLSASEEIEEYANKNSKKRAVDDEGLIVVASLLDHLPNLGGLCRTCEIFGVHKYVINSLKVVNDQHFQSLSVSAQNWVNIMEVPVRDLESCLFTYSAKGYTILGVEQANESSSLTDFDFPKKSVLLLGNEKLGIPPELLRLVDKCIEIPQVGIIRSLNVHVTGALCIWQYSSQNIL